MTYARLALLAADRNDLNAAAKYRSRSEAQCPHPAWKSCSADEISRLAKRVDEQSTSIWNRPPASDQGT
jgi:hypothetical protein